AAWSGAHTPSAPQRIRYPGNAAPAERPLPGLIYAPPTGRRGSRLLIRRLRTAAYRAVLAPAPPTALHLAVLTRKTARAGTVVTVPARAVDVSECEVLCRSGLADGQLAARAQLTRQREDQRLLRRLHGLDRAETVLG